MKTLILSLLLIVPVISTSAAKMNAAQAVLKTNQSYMTESHGAIYILKVEKKLVTFKLQERASEGCPPPSDVPEQKLAQEKFTTIHQIYAAIDCEQDRKDREEFEKMIKQ